MTDDVVKRHESSAAPSHELGGSDPGTVELGGRIYATQEELARRLGKTPRTLARWKNRRIGPPQIRVGSLVLYDLGKLAAWLESHEDVPLRKPDTSARSSR